MRRAAWSALVVAAAAVAALVAAESSTVTSTSEDREGEQEDESDSAPFMIVVEHPNGRRCSGSLVSLRTALTSAGCVRGAHGEPPRELWARAVGAGAVRRVARVALAAEGEHADAADLAVLELEAPFGGGSRARPILMATQPAECAPRATCHVVRALGHAPRLRIVDAALEPPDTCSKRAHAWPDAALCLQGPTLCGAEWGAGVVCEGKLCGVVSRSVRAGDAPPTEPSQPSDLDDTCGDTHAAQSVARWRRFLHCAHTLRACGRGGDCAQLCTERRLLTTDEEEQERGGPGSGPAATPPTTTELPDTMHPTTTSLLMEPLVLTPRGVSRSVPTRSSAATTPASSAAAGVSVRPAFEFEPNRADFKGGRARTSRVYLKAGEYGDNGAAEYGGEEAAPLPRASAPPPSSSAPPAPSRAPADLQAQQASSPPSAPRVARSGATVNANIPLLLLFLITINFGN